MTNHLPAPTQPSDPATAIIRECAMVTLATIAFLIDTPSRREAAAVRSSWMTFLFQYPQLAAQEESWVGAWWLFWDSAEAAVSEHN